MDLFALLTVVLLIALNFSDDGIAISKIQSIATGISAILTAFYVSLTYGILLDGKKSRKAAFISKQLEEFYRPLELFFDYHMSILHFSVVPNSNEIMLVPQFRKKYENMDISDSIQTSAYWRIDKPESQELYLKLYNQNYLMKPESDKVIGRLFTGINCFSPDLSEKMSISEMLVFLKALEEAIGKDIKDLTGELFECR